MALARVASDMSNVGEFTFIAMTVDHRLRAESKKEAEFTKKELEKLGVCEVCFELFEPMPSVMSILQESRV